MRFAIKEACGKRSKNDFSNGKRSQTTSMFHLHFAISSPMCMYACAHVQAPLWQISKRFFEVLWGTNNMCDGVPHGRHFYSSYTAYDAVLRYGCTVLRYYWYRTLFTCYLLTDSQILTNKRILTLSTTKRQLLSLIILCRFSPLQHLR